MPPEQGSGESARRKKRIALFTGNYNHIADGVSLTLNRLVRFLERQGHDVRVFAPTVADPAIEHAGTLIPVPSVPLPGRPEYRISLGMPRRVKEYVRDFQPDLVHIATPDLLGWSALRLAERYQYPVVTTYHTHFSSYLKYYRAERLEPLLWRMLRRFYRRCHHIYVPTQSMADVLAAQGITDGLMLWPRGVDRALFHENRRSNEWRKELGFAEDDVVLTFVSRLVLEKGLSVFAEVVEKASALRPNVRSLVVGEGPARAELESRLPGAVFTGHLSGPDLARAYASSDVFVFPSDTETFGNVVLEAMACALPSVCADATGSKSLVEDGVSGFLATAGDSTDFVEKVISLVDDDELRRTMGARALSRAGMFYWDAVLERIERYYDLALNDSPALTASGGTPPRF
jgi:phosphatidylinositol alpha 1,6-mannosyltransferase